MTDAQTTQAPVNEIAPEAIANVQTDAPTEETNTQATPRESTQTDDGQSETNQPVIEHDEPNNATKTVRKRSRLT